LNIHHLKIPKVITHEMPHNHSINPWHIHHLPYVGPYIKHANVMTCSVVTYNVVRV
jgi:hypothetical protein